MRFYDALQLDPSILKRKIRESEQPRERHKLMTAIAVRSLLIVLFAIMMISPVAPVFGPENSPMAVALFCILLGIRFVDFGYCIKDSMINLAVVFTLLLLAPSAAANVNLVFSAIIHVAAFFTILFMTSDRPEMGNAGIYTFAYIYLSGNPVTGQLLWNRALLTLVGYILCGTILFVKHRKKNPSVRFWSLVTGFSVSNKKTQWHAQLALGVGLILALGSFLQLPRMMWAAFACGSVLGCYAATAAEAKTRVVQRIVGVVLGSAVFFLLYQICPVALRSMLGPLGGFCLGFYTDYRFKTASNCIGAIYMVEGSYGLNTSVFLRVGHNLLGVSFGFLFLVVYQKIVSKCLSDRTEDSMESPTA